MKLFGRKLKFASPKKVDIVIFDEVLSDLVVRTINKSYSYCVFNQRPEDMWVGFNVFRKLFDNLSHFQWEDALKHQRGFIVGTIKQLRLLYYKSCLDVINPKAVVTFIDNSLAFGWLSKHCRECPFIAIQNGSRLSYAASHDSGYHVQHFFSYGYHEKDLFPRLGYQVENFYPVGSLLASLYFDQQLKHPSHHYDLLIVSAWRGNIGFQLDVQDTMRSMSIMDRLLSRYIEENGLKAAVIMRSERGSKDWIMPEVGMSEEQYYKNIYRDTVDIVETDFSKRNIFPMMLKSEVIISCLSSGLLEAYGMKKKILFCNFTGTDRYHCDFHPAIVTTQPAWDELSIRLNGLLTQKDDDYQKEHKEMMDYYMAFPDGALTHEYIAIKIDEIIEQHSVISL
jgi:surface carbohydrate biosynthesis protein